MSTIFAATLWCQRNMTWDQLPGWVYVVAAVAALAILAAICGEARIRCPRCGFQTRQKNTTAGTCPNCGSLEFHH